MDSVVYNENINTEDLNERADRVNIIKEYEDIVKQKEHNIFCISTR